MSRNGHLKNEKFSSSSQTWKTAIYDSDKDFESAKKDLQWWNMELRINWHSQKYSSSFWKGQMTPADMSKLVKISAAVEKWLK